VVDSKKSDAVLDKGKLRLTLPKKKEAKPRKIKPKHKVAAKGVKVEKTEEVKAETKVAKLTR